MNLNKLQKICKHLRNFNAANVLKEKTKLINEFFKNENLDTAVIGISGGIDSALVLKLLIHASEQVDSPIQLIQGLSMPIYTYGITGQNEAMSYTKLLNDSINSDKYSYRNCDLTNVAKAYDSVNITKSVWAVGQLNAIIRTPMLYGAAAHLQSNDFKSIVVGATNRDEGAYIGFFGKASDAMVDLQPIADLHKSEVYALSKLLNVPTEIIQRTPTGDTYDRSKDEETIGSPYWFLELYQQLIDYNLLHKLSDLGEKYLKYAMNIESIHLKNAHKYKVGSPSRYVDVLKRKVDIFF